MADIPGNSTTTQSIAVGGTLSDTLEVVGDRDWVRIDLTAGQSISVFLDGLTLEDPYLRIRDASGTILYENDDITSGVNRDSLLAFTATYTGTYFIDVGAWEDNYTGTYQLSVSVYTPPPLATVDQIADQLVSGYWGGEQHRFNVTQGGSLAVNLTALTAEGQQLARAALAAWTDIIGVNFVEVASGGQIKFDDNEAGAHASSIYSGGFISSSEVNVSAQWLADYGTTLNSYAFQAYIHEIGHALGLGHAGNYNSEARYPFDARFQNDSWAMSVMSYFDQRENTYFAGLGFSHNLAVTPMMADVVAMSRLYGLSTTTRTDDTVYGSGWHTNMGALCIFDSGGNDTIDTSGMGGDQRIDLNPGSFSNIMGEIGNVSIAPGVIIENALGGSGHDTVIGNGSANALWGHGGNDVLTGLAGNDFLDGGAGLDTAIFSDLFRSYSVNVTGANGTVTGAKEGADTLTSIEVVQLKDGKFVFNADGVAAQVTRLYDTVLQRAPDQAGLDLWVDRLEDQGGTLKDVAKGFLNSPEFQGKSGSLSNADYVEILYQNALGRASDPGGKAAWVEQLNSGASDRADLLIGFSESSEHRGLTADLVAKGFFNTDDAYQAVALLYDSFAGRLPDSGGLIGWAEAIKSGAMTVSQVAAGFANSPEFQNLTAGMTHSQLVEFMYQNTLNRGSDPGGKQAWVNALDAGLSDGDLLIGFSQSQEHFFLLEPQITNGIDYF